MRYTLSMLHLLRKKKKRVNKHDHVIDRLAEVNAIFSGIALFPQLIEVWKTHNVQGLSQATFLITFVTNIIWGCYGIHRKDTAVAVASILVVISAGGLSLLSFLWRT